MGRLKIESVGGGFTGVGAPGVKLKSSGEQAVSALSAADQAAIDALFKSSASSQSPNEAGNIPRYRITRSENGQSVVVPETAVPLALKACLRDKLL